jgi:bis(5'-nucleosyl)-tetraphosphatase (symmetrical)
MSVPWRGDAPQKIFIGDVQGCADELHELLDRATKRFGDEFELYVVGDLINRGPDNLRALRAVRELVEAGRAHYVLGNHELAFLRAAFELRGIGEHDTYHDILESKERDDWVLWLRRLPLIVEGRIGRADFLMVHASVDPDWTREDAARAARKVAKRLGADSLRKPCKLLADRGKPIRPGSSQDLLGRMTACRSVREGQWSSAIPAEGWVAWHREWSRRKHDYGLVYGHWALQGLHVARGLRGLDTGCVHHGRGSVGHLTAWLPDEGTLGSVFTASDERFWQVRAHRRYYAT